MPRRFEAASRSLLAKPFSKSPAIENPVNAPPRATACKSDHTNWKAAYPSEKSKPGTCPTLERPPAKATKKNMGKSAGVRNAGLVKNRYTWRHATAPATEKNPPKEPRVELLIAEPLMRGPSCLLGKPRLRRGRGQ